MSSAIVYTPAAMLADADALNADFERVAADVLTSSVGAAFRAQWIAFSDGWGAFYRDLQGVSGWVDRLWGSTQVQIDSYRTQLREWTIKFRNEGGRLTGAEVTPPSDGFDLVAILKWTALAAVAIGITVYVLPRVAK